MKIIGKLVLSFILFVIIWISIIIYISSTVGIKGYQQLESERIMEETRILERVIDDEIKKDEFLLSDWAAWDPIYDFVIGKQNSIPEGDLNDVFYIDQEINYVLMLDVNMNLILGEAFDLESESYTELPPAFVAEVKNHINQSGLLYIDGEWIAFSSEQVTDSHEEMEAKGLLVFAHKLDANRQEILSEIIGEELIFVSGEFCEKESINFNQNSTTILSSTRSLNKKMCLTVKYSHPHNIISLGQKTIRQSILWFSLTFLSSMILLYLSVRIIISRLLKLRKDVDTIRHSNDLSKRVSEKGMDEISELGQDINKFIEDLEGKTNKLNELAYYDELTGVLNRRAGLEKLESYLDQFDNNNKALTISYIDIDSLKLVNDQYGHIEGDRYINIVISSIMEVIKDKNLIVRLGGDEFMLIFPEKTEFEAKKEITKISKHLSSQQKGLIYELGFSYGILSYRLDLTCDTFIDEADAKMYKLKKKRKNKIKNQ